MSCFPQKGHLEDRISEKVTLSTRHHLSWDFIESQERTLVISRANTARQFSSFINNCTLLYCLSRDVALLCLDGVQGFFVCATVDKTYSVSIRFDHTSFLILSNRARTTTNNQHMTVYQTSNRHLQLPSCCGQRIGICFFI